MTVQSFSGAHPFRPQCLLDAIDPEEADAEWSRTAVDHAAELIADIESDRCPRCGREGLQARPAGSRITRCRCVPICGPCGGHEASVALVTAGSWPIFDPSTVDEDLQAADANGSVGILDPTTGIVVSEEGASEIKPRPHPGGWAEFGFDDQADTEERES